MQPKFIELEKAPTKKSMETAEEKMKRKFKKKSLGDRLAAEQERSVIGSFSYKKTYNNVSFLTYVILDKGPHPQPLTGIFILPLSVKLNNCKWVKRQLFQILTFSCRSSQCFIWDQSVLVLPLFLT